MRPLVLPRTIQFHLTHVHIKLGVTSRVQLVQEAARATTRSSASQQGDAEFIDVIGISGYQWDV